MDKQGKVRLVVFHNYIETGHIDFDNNEEGDICVTDHMVGFRRRGIESIYDASTLKLLANFKSVATG